MRVEGGAAEVAGAWDCSIREPAGRVKVRILTVSWACLLDWDGFSPWTRVWSMTPAGLCVVTALPPLSGLGPAQPVASSASASQMERKEARRSTAAGSRTVEPPVLRGSTAEGGLRRVDEP